MLLVSSNGEIISTVNEFAINQYLKKGYTEYIEPKEKPKAEVKPKAETKVATKK